MKEQKPITIVGCGPGSSDYLTTEAVKAVEKAAILLGSERLLGLFSDVDCRKLVCPSHPGAAAELIESLLPDNPVTVLVSGDPGLFSLSRGLVAHFGMKYCRIIPGISALQVAFSRLGVDWREARILSSHAVDPQWDAEKLAEYDTIAILGGRPAGYPRLIEKIAELKDQYSVTLLENLTLPDERVRQIKINELTTTDAASLVIVVLQRITQ